MEATPSCPALRYEAGRKNTKRYRLTASEYGKIQKFDAIEQELKDCQEKNKQLTDELNKYMKENSDLSRVLNQWVPNPSFLPCRVKEEQLN